MKCTLNPSKIINTSLFLFILKLDHFFPVNLSASVLIDDIRLGADSAAKHVFNKILRNWN